jgi:hypothetical protein
LTTQDLSMTEKYVKVYLSSLKAKYDAYRLKKQQTSASEMMSQVQITQPEGDADGGWVKNKNAGKMRRQSLSKLARHGSSLEHE